MQAQEAELQLVSILKRTATTHRFPEAVEDVSAQGFYGSYFADDLARQLRWADDLARQRRKKEDDRAGKKEGGVLGNARAKRDFVSRIAFDSLMLRKLLKGLLDPAAGGSEWFRCASFDQWSTTLKQCCSSLPDVTHYGQVEMTRQTLVEEFKGDIASVVHDLCEKHRGEIRMVESKETG